MYLCMYVLTQEWMKIDTDTDIKREMDRYKYNHRSEILSLCHILLVTRKSQIQSTIKVEGLYRL